MSFDYLMLIISGTVSRVLNNSPHIHPGTRARVLKAIQELLRAGRLLDDTTEANRRGDWGFYEFHHGLRHEPGGMPETAWSAGGQIMAHHAVLHGRTPADLIPGSALSV